MFRIKKYGILGLMCLLVLVSKTAAAGKTAGKTTPETVIRRRRWATMRQTAMNVLEEDWGTDCPCTDPALCTPVAASASSPVADKELYGFGPGIAADHMNWTWATTVAWATSTDMLCAAHEAGARVVMAAPDVPITSNVTERKVWIERTVAAMQAKWMDGIVFDFESPLPARGPKAQWYAELISETTAALHSLAPGYQVSTCVAWSPDDIDGRGYDMPALAAASDILYVMDYDTRSQIFDQCVASANAPFPGTVRGMSRYLDIGVEPEKLVLGVPWYGYRYPCLPGTTVADTTCPIAQVPFRGVNCSDAAGSEVSFANVMATFANATAAGSASAMHHDPNMQAPFFTMKDASSDGGTVHQYWFDDARLIGMKAAYAKQIGALGLGPFTFGDLFGSDQAVDVWSSLDAFFE